MSDLVPSDWAQTSEMRMEQDHRDQSIVFSFKITQRDLETVQMTAAERQQLNHAFRNDSPVLEKLHMLMWFVSRLAAVRGLQ